MEAGEDGDSASSVADTVSNRIAAHACSHPRREGGYSS